MIISFLPSLLVSNDQNAQIGKSAFSLSRLLGFLFLFVNVGDIVVAAAVNFITSPDQFIGGKTKSKIRLIGLLVGEIINK